MEVFGEILRSSPDLAKNIRVISIATNQRLNPREKDLTKNKKPCQVINWNGNGRNRIYNDSTFYNMWWLEIDWTYQGMFTGDQPYQMMHKLAEYGALGLHIKDVVQYYNRWKFFKAGDTPSVLYLIDPENNLNDPMQGSWAGKFTKPFPEKRQNYYTDLSGSVKWDYSNPCNTWENRNEMSDHAKSTLEEVRQEMYDELLIKLDILYRKNSN